MTSATTQIAHELGVTKTEAIAFAKRVKKLYRGRLLFRRILGAIRKLEPDQRTPENVVDLLNKGASQRDGVGKRTTSRRKKINLSEIAEGVYVKTGGRVTPTDIRKSLNKLGPNVSVATLIDDLSNNYPTANIAMALDLEMAQAAEVFKEIRQTLGEDVDKADILIALGTLDDSERNPDQLLENIAILKISQQMGISFTDAADLKNEITDKFELPIRSVNILSLLKEMHPDERQLTKLITIFRIVPGPDADFGTVLWQLREVTKILGVDYQEEDVLEIFSAFEDAYIRPTQIRHIVKQYQLSKQLGMNFATFNTLVTEIENQYDAYADPMKIAEAVESLGALDRTVENVLRVLRAKEFATLLNIDFGRAMGLSLHFKTVDELLVNVREAFYEPVEDEVIRRAIVASNPEELSLSEILSKIELVLIADQINSDIDTAANLSKRIGEAFEIWLTNREILLVLQFMDDRDDFEQTLVEVVWIAQKLDTSIEAVCNYISEIEHGFGDTRKASTNDIAQTLNDSRGEISDVGDIVAFLKIKSFLEESEREESPMAFASWVNGQLEQPVSYPVLSHGLEQIKVRNQPVESIVNYLDDQFVFQNLGPLINLGRKKTEKLRRHIEQRTGREVSLRQLLEYARFLPGPHLTFDHKTDFLTLARVYETSSSVLNEIDRLTISVAGNILIREKFWEIFSTMIRSGDFTIADASHTVEYLELRLKTGPYLESNTGDNERQITQKQIESIANTMITKFRRGLSNEKRIQQLNELKAKAWNEIGSPLQQYQVPTRGQAEILATDRINTLIKLKSVRFITEGATPPGLYLKFTFDTLPITFGLVHVFEDGRISGFQRLANNQLFQAMIAAISITYYRDLVTPDYLTGREFIPTPSHYSQPNSLILNKRTFRARKRTIPRKPYDHKKTAQLSDWYQAQNRARHLVVGHLRYIDRGFRARPEKQQQATAVGVEIPPGYTWVIEHERGDPSRVPIIMLDGYDLAKHTLFRPPRRAKDDLNRILV